MEFMRPATRGATLISGDGDQLMPRVKAVIAGSRQHRSPGHHPQMPYHVRKALTMLAIIATVLFVIAFILNAAGTSVSAVFSPFSLMLIGLACLALHLAGVGTGWRVRR